MFDELDFTNSIIELLLITLPMENLQIFFIEADHSKKIIQRNYNRKIDFPAQMITEMPKTMIAPVEIVWNSAIEVMAESSQQTTITTARKAHNLPIFIFTSFSTIL